MKKDKLFLRMFFSVFLVVPENVFTFISGVFLAVAINIATSQLPNSFWTCLPGTIIASMFLMFACCVFFMWIGISVKPYRDNFSSISGKKNFTDRSRDWLSYLVGKKVKAKWSILFLLSMATMLASIVLILI